MNTANSFKAYQGTYVSGTYPVYVADHSRTLTVYNKTAYEEIAKIKALKENRNYSYSFETPGGQPTVVLQEKDLKPTIKDPWDIWKESNSLGYNHKK